jgi:hypothetical protein
MAPIRIGNAAARFSRLLHAAARILGIEPHVQRTFGVDRGRFTVPDDFDAPLPDEVLDDFQH